MGNGPQKEGLSNSPGISLVVHSLRGGPPLSEEQRNTPQLELGNEFSSWV